MSTPDRPEQADLPDGEIGLLPDQPGPTGAGVDTDQGADPAAPEVGESGA